MHHLKRNRHPLGVFLLAASLVLALAAGAHAQELEIEPNHPCTAAQDLGWIAETLAVDGNIDSSDVDFYRLTATPNASATVRLSGVTSGLGSLGDPYLGIFSSDCSVLLARNDDYYGLDSQIRLTVPADGSFIVAATSYGDFDFSGMGYDTGSYQLGVEIQEQTNARSVSGRLVDARTGSPLLNAYVTLYRCWYGSCWNYIGSYYTWNGEFRFESGVYPLYAPLQEGEYRIVVEAYNYDNLATEVFYLAPGEERDLGALALQPYPRVGSIRGRVIDQLTGAPLAGLAVPYPLVQLEYCYDEWYCYPVRYTVPDAEGRFLFESSTWDRILPGSYQIRVSADQYESATGARFTVNDGEHRDTGDLGLKSFPVRIYLDQPCNSIPSRGGQCQFTVRIVNGMPGRLQGETWSVVSASGIGSPTYSTVFQTGTARSVSLASAASTTVPFTFQVPASVSDGAYICVQTLVAQRPHSFNTIGSHFDFCLFKGGYGFTVVPEERKREAVEKSRGDRRHPTPRKP